MEEADFDALAERIANMVVNSVTGRPYWCDLDARQKRLAKDAVRLEMHDLVSENSSLRLRLALAIEEIERRGGLMQRLQADLDDQLTKAIQR